jgi:hypothetical protein
MGNMFVTAKTLVEASSPHGMATKIFIVLVENPNAPKISENWD